MDSASTQTETITVRRVLPGSPERVFACWTEAEHLANWFRPQPTLTTPLVELDLRVGGKYRIGIHDAEKDETYICNGEFKEIDPPRKVAYTWDWENPGMSGIDSLVTVEFEPHGDAETEVTVTHAFADPAKVGHHEQGWEGCLAQLESLLGSKG